MTENRDLKTLLDRYLSETIGPEEIDKLFATLQQEQYTGQWQQAIEELLDNKSLHGLSDSTRMQQLLQAVLAVKGGQAEEGPAGEQARVVPIRGTFGQWWKYAAAIILFLSAAGYWQWRRGRQDPGFSPAVAQRFKNDLQPGSNKATLVLANGAKIVLDSAADGELTRQGSTSVLKADSGQLVYNGLQEKSAVLLYNTVSTPRGGQYHLALSDGTRVWLDAASSLRFPVSFDGAERQVELTGEAYFEVAANEKAPFTVKVGSARIQVLGTHFNINAYDDEDAIMTTLLEGRVKVVGENTSVLLETGQQAQLSRANEINVLKDPDVEAVMAWKNGVFQLRSADIRSIMRQAARWYDVDVKYEGGSINQTFYGTIPRSVSAINLFKVLEETGGVHLAIDGKTVTVSP